MTRLFGTDGVRGIANDELTCEIAYRLGQAAGRFLGERIVVGRDTRRSGDMLESALCAGIMSVGATAHVAGIIPTPAVALLTRSLKANGGIVISASHNAPEYNGIKFFDSQGFKLPDAVEDRIADFVMAGGYEGMLSEAASEAGDARVVPIVGVHVGRLSKIKDAREIYIQHCVSEILHQGIDFEGMNIALDTAHGASSKTSPETLIRLGARVSVINDSFSGDDINVACGSTHLEALIELVRLTKADIGIAHDGDADRVMIVASDGHVLDGDDILAMCAIDMKRRGQLSHNTVVATVMSNLGFTHAMQREGIEVVHTKVGDRYVLEEMRAHGYAAGGEQSGHMILLRHNTTGDGLMTACQFLAALKRNRMTTLEVSRLVERYPQTLINVPVKDKSAIDGHPAIGEAVRNAEAELGDEGRVLLRPSGTEPLVRVMVEAKTQKLADAHAQAIANVVKSVC